MADGTQCIVRVPGSLFSTLRESCVPETPLRNLNSEFLAEEGGLQVAVRVKPCPDSEHCFTVKGNEVIFTVQKDNMKGKSTKALHTLGFTKIFKESTTQEDLFNGYGLDALQNFFEGLDTLLFTYGASGAGKTHTMLGTSKDPGLLPRSLDVIFNSLEGKMLKSICLKPLGMNEIMKLAEHQSEAEELERSILLKESDMTELESSIRGDWQSRRRQLGECRVQFPEQYHSVWVSYCEIYNEQAFDLLDNCARGVKRAPLRVTEDRKGKFYVKGLKEVCVRSADEAFQVLLRGKENLHFAATKLNHNSSRSHCLFTVKLIRTKYSTDPNEAAFNTMSFCDLAGMERTTKTHSRGDRLKEAGNINTSLLILGRCLETIRNNQQNPHAKNIIPYRDSKLTKILHTFFSGRGRAVMVVSVSPSMLLSDETLHVLKFGALAQNMVIQPEAPSASEASSASLSFLVPAKQPSRFQQYVRKSIGMALGSFRASEAPSFNAIQEEGDEASLGAGARVVAQLNEQIAQLKDEVKGVKSAWWDNERKVRDEVTNEWEELLSRLETSWRERHEETVARYEEFIEKRTNMLTNYANSCSKKRKKAEIDEDDAAGAEVHRLAIQLRNKEGEITALGRSNVSLNQSVDQLKNNLKASERDKDELQRELTKLQFQLATSSTKPRLDFLGSQLEDGDVVAGADAEQISVAALQAQLLSKEQMLNEAVIEFHSKNEECAQAQQQNEALNKELEQLKEQLSDLQNQVEKGNLLLTDANDRLEQREEELMSLEEKLTQKSAQIGNANAELREAKRKLRGYESSDSTNATSALNKELEQLKEHLAGLQNQVEKGNLLLADANDRLEQREEELTSFEEKLNQKSAQIGNANTELREVKRKLRVYESSDSTNATMCQNLADELQKQLLAAEANLEQAKDEVDALQQQVSSLQGRLETESELKREIGDLKQQLLKAGDRAEQCADLEKEVAGLREERDRLAALQGTIGDLHERIVEAEDRAGGEMKSSAALRDRLAELKDRLDSAVEDGRRLNELNADLQEKLAERQEKVERLEWDLHDRTGATQDADKERLLLQKSLKEVLQCQVRWTDEKKDLCDALDKKDKLVQDLKSQLESVRENQSKLVITEAELKSVALKLRSTEAEKERLEKVCQRSETQLAELQQGQSRSCDSVADLEKKVRNLESQLAARDCTVADLQDHERTLLANNDLLESQMEKLNKEILRHVMRIEELQKSNKQLHQDLQGQSEREESLAGQLKDAESLRRRLQEQEDVLNCKNDEVDRLEREMKRLLTGNAHLYQGDPIKGDPEAKEDEVVDVEPTPVRARRGRPRKVSSPDLPPPVSSVSRSRTKKVIDAEASEVASAKKVSARKGSKTKTAPHPALSETFAPTNDDNSMASATSAGSRRRLYNSKCPELLQPTTKDEVDDDIGTTIRTSTRPRKPIHYDFS